MLLRIYFVSIWGLILLQRKNIKTKLDVIKIMELIKKATFFGASGKYIFEPDEIPGRNKSLE